MIHEFEGKTEKEAIDTAIESLGLNREEIDVEILENKKKGFLFGGGKVKIRVHLGEEGDEQAVVDEVLLFCETPVTIDEVGYLLKREKGDAQRQKDIRRYHLSA